jgi:hypothetical protein
MCAGSAALSLRTCNVAVRKSTKRPLAECQRLSVWEALPIAPSFTLKPTARPNAAPEATGRPSYHPSVLLKLYIYVGYLVRHSIKPKPE